MERRLVKPFVALVFVQFCFASLAVAGKFALAAFPALMVAGMRIFFASLFLGALALAVRREQLTLKDGLKLFWLSLMGIVCNQLLFLKGLSLTTAVNASILIATIPVWTMLVAILIGQERPRAVRITGIAIAIAGGLVLLGVEALQLRSDYAIGNLLVVLNALSYSFYLVFSRSLLKKYRSTTIVGWTFLYGALLVTPFAAVEAARFNFSAVPALAWWAMVWIILFPSVISYSLNNYALKRIQSSTVATYVFLQPLFGVAMALLLLPEETFTVRTLIGGALVLLGVVLVSRNEAIEPMMAVPESGEAMSRQPIVDPDGRAEPKSQEDH